MRIRLRWQGWRAEVTPRAIRLLVIATLLAVGAGANTRTPGVPMDSLSAGTPIVASNAPPPDSAKANHSIKLAPRTTFRRSLQMQQATEELRTRGLLLPVPDLTPDQLHDSFLALRGDGSRRHYAVDIPAARGTPVLCVDDGMVLQLHESRTGGISLYATEPNGRFIYFYAHLDHYNPRMREGLALSRGDTIGYVGTTGNAAPDAPHLHFAILIASNVTHWSSGTPVNPVEVWK